MSGGNLVTGIKNLNGRQWITIAIAILSVLAISSNNLTDMFGPRAAKIISSTANMINAMLAGILGAITGQSHTVKEVADMEGVEPLKINAKANPTLASIALDPEVDNVTAVPDDIDKIVDTANGGKKP